jgi:GNAT superfamily N-acetyltransferase
MIIPLKESNYNAVWDLFQLTFDESEDSYFQDAWKTRDRNVSLGYWKHTTLLGVTIARNHRLHYIFVSDEHQNKGIGSNLLHSVLALCPNLHLTSVNNPNIHAWYVKHGFRLSQIEDDYRLYVHHEHNLRSRS